MNITYILFEQKEAKKCKEAGMTYEMYTSYLAQYDYQNCKVVPMPEQEYNKIRS